mmetsp:Transcript_126929/g.237313  ORF Transcript_126929/g.237313 Transcript_126929/m.237313 type:complete len:479 (-) Transcript_126929:77-1513(-)
MLPLPGESSPSTSWRCNQPSPRRWRCHSILSLCLGVLVCGQPACETTDISVGTDLEDFSRSSFDDLLDDSDLESISLLQKKAHVTRRPTQPRSSSPTSKQAEQAGTMQLPATPPLPPATTGLAANDKNFKGGAAVDACGLLCRILVERGDANLYMNLGMLCFGALIVFISLALWCCGKTADPMLKVQFQVDHFVSHSILHPQRLSAEKLLKGTLHSASAAERLLRAPAVAQIGAKPASCTDVEESRSTALAPWAKIGPPAAGKAKKSGGRLQKQMEPILTLPLCETWYAVSIESMMHKDGSFDISRIAGYPMLHGRLRRACEARWLEISSSGLPGKDGQTLAAVSMPLRYAGEAAPVGQGPTFKVSGHRGRHVGDLRPVKEGQYALTCAGADFMSVAVDSDQLVVYAADNGKALAQASWFDDAEIFEGIGHLAICVNSGVDTVLAISCVLAMIVFGEEAGLPGLPCKSAPAAAPALAG